MSRKSKPASWIDSAVFYEIYPQTFFDSNNDGIGDLEGIIRKLDYVQSLGVNAIWLNPFYVSPFRDAGYDVSDYCRVAPRYGTNADAKRLFREAGRRGLRVIIDFVPGHTSIDHPWFKASCSEKPNRYSNRFVWTDNTWDSGGEKFKANMVSGYCNRNGNFITNFFWHQPALNFGFAKPAASWQLSTMHPDVQAMWTEARKIMKFWLDLGCSGFRVDMAGSMIRNDPDAREAIRFWQETRNMFDREYPGTFTVSEWSYPKHAVAGGFTADFFHWFSEYGDLFRKESWRSLNGLSDGNSYFDHEGKGDITRFLTRYLEHYRATKEQGHISIPVGNHDLTRININHTPRELEGIYAFLLTMPGVPFLYYGDEIGMRQVPGCPVREGCYPPRAGARTPMQWKPGRNLGFSQAPASKLWMPVDPAKDAPTVEGCERGNNTLLQKTRHLVRLRRNEKALQAGADFNVIYAEKSRYPFVYERRAGTERILIAINPAGRAVSIPLKQTGAAGSTELLAGIGATLSASAPHSMLKMESASYGIFKTAY